MKTKSLLKAAFITAMFLGLGWSAEAQITASGVPSKVKADSGEETDYVTVGSTIPYKVNKYDWQSLSSTFGSMYKWAVTGDGTDRELYKNDGTTALPFLAAPNAAYSLENEIGIKWVTVGDYTISVKEAGRVIATGVATTCEGAEETLPIKVLDRPTVGWTTTTEVIQCGTDPVDIPLILSGSKEWKVKYSITFTPLTGSAKTIDLSGAEITVDATSTITSTGAYGQTGLAEKLGSLTIGDYGKYEVKITGISDKISTKSGVATVVGTDYPLATTMFTVYSLPIPTTSPIQHVANN